MCLHILEHRKTKQPLQYMPPYL